MLVFNWKNVQCKSALTLNFAGPEQPLVDSGKDCCACRTATEKDQLLFLDILRKMKWLTYLRLLGAIFQVVLLRLSSADFCFVTSIWYSEIYILSAQRFHLAIMTNGH